MKALSISGFILGLFSFIGGLYLHFMLAPAAEALESSLETGFSDEMTSLMFMAAHEAKVGTGETLVIIGGIAFIISGIAAIKTKSKLAIAGTLMSFIGLLAGLVHGTHMFS